MCSIIRVSTRGRAGDDALERGVELGQRRLGEEAEAAEVDGRGRRRRRRRGRCGRAVASSVPSPPSTTIRSTRDGSASAGTGAMRGRCRRRAALASSSTGVDAARASSHGDQVAHDARPAVEPRLDDDPDAADGRPVHGVSLSGRGAGLTTIERCQELAVALGAGDRRRRRCRGATRPSRGRLGHDLGDDALVHGRDRARCRRCRRRRGRPRTAA